MKKLTVIIISIITYCTLSSCDTRRTIYPESGVWVVVNLDWQNLESDPNGATVVFYPQTREASQSYLYTNYSTDSIYLTKDEYHVVVMNETPTSHTNLTFTNKSSFDEYVATIDETSVTLSGATESQMLATEPDILLLEQSLDFEITRESVIDNQRYVLNFTPMQVTKNLQVTLYLRGVSNLGSSAHSVVVGGMSSGVMVGSSEYSSDPTSHYLIFTKGTLDDSDDSGYLQGSISCFDDIYSAENPVTIRLSLRDGSYYEIDYDATGDIYEDVDNELQLYLNLYDKDAGGSDGDYPGILLPDVEDDEEDDDDDDSGFGAVVGDWEDEENVPVTVN